MDNVQCMFACVCVCVCVLRWVTKELCYSTQIPSSCPGTHIPRYWQAWLLMAPSHTPQWELSSAAQKCLLPGSAPSWGWSMTSEQPMCGKKPSSFASILGQFWRSSWLQNSPKDQSSLSCTCISPLFPNPVLLPSPSYQCLSQKHVPVTFLLATLLLRAHYQETQLMIHDKLLLNPVLSYLQSQGLGLESSGQPFLSLSSLPCIFSAWRLPEKPGFPDLWWSWCHLKTSFQHCLPLLIPSFSGYFLWERYQFLQESIWLAQLSFSSRATSEVANKPRDGLTLWQGPPSSLSAVVTGIRGGESSEPPFHQG